VSTALVAVALLWVGVPRVLRGLEWFRVRRIELVGVRHLAPDAVVAALRLDATASIFVDRTLLADRVKGVRGVLDARVERRFPAALTVLVREAEPVAFTPASGGLSVLDGAGRKLPYDPARSALDLPIAQTPDSGIAAVLGLVRAVDPELFRAVLSARAVGESVLLQLESTRLLFRADAGPAEVRAVVRVAHDLTARGRSYRELDARYDGQVVVRQARGARS
jgi:cell division septal protein FtsQ